MTSKRAVLILMSTAIAVLSASRALPARAETVLVNDQLAVRKSDVPHPARGLTMTSVEAKFGAPSSRHSAVGAPPITRWDYGQFAVFFEKDRVIDAVIPPASQPEALSTAVAAQAQTNGPEAPSASTAASMPQTAAPQDSTPSEPIPATLPSPKEPPTPETPSSPTAPASSAAPSLPAARQPATPPSVKGGDVLLPVSIPTTASPASPKH
jgi:hypothetical protein